jgi:hypothetical protein
LQRCYCWRSRWISPAAVDVALTLGLLAAFVSIAFVVELMRSQAAGG